MVHLVSPCESVVREAVVVCCRALDRANLFAHDEISRKVPAHRTTNRTTVDYGSRASDDESDDRTLRERKAKRLSKLDPYWTVSGASGASGGPDTSESVGGGEPHPVAGARAHKPFACTARK
ncbi:hypothetical protein THAOC_04458 [Thalassiosira oceanica]|uniref:Uncharacterized protein n=1 Tax=Thalassiosira oceanica TaxID=159749 RepID=K0TJ46_THAOC|nr:hypothetical protein THAOC_04458 [Thalassiosira oceanica]|eukprot:EJK73901.1 hypothetical protein THAOC_04458 [Thalassiosira oceanica]